MKFAINDFFETKEGNKCKIIGTLGQGAQGTVYLVDYDGKQYALKIYKENPSQEFKNNIFNNIHTESPSENFLWPKVSFEWSDGTFGCLMDLIPNTYSSFISYLNGKTNFKNLVTKLNWCIELANSFKALHEKGYSYQDINDGSFFLEGETGKLLICDNDNITANKNNLGILGKIKYMAPEIVRGDINPLTNKPQLPDIYSDRFSIAVILFMTLCYGNPFEGKKLKDYLIVDAKAEYELYGKDPVYIYSKVNFSNRPIHGYHTTVMNIYPTLPFYIKEAFHRTFVDGIRDRENGRVTELEWIKLLCRYRDEITKCEKCGNEFYHKNVNYKSENLCPNCNGTVAKKFVLYIGKKRILLHPGKCIYDTHLNKFSDKYTLVKGEVIKNTHNPNLWGIKLNLENDVKIRDTNLNTKTINSRGIIPIIKDLEINFGTVIGKIVIE